MNEETMQNAIMFRCGLLETFYPDPYTLRNMVRIWFTQNLTNFNKLWELYNLDYDPLNTVDYTRSGSEDGVESNQEQSGREQEVADNNTENIESSANTENTVSAFNSDSYQPDNKTENNGESTRTTQDSRSLTENSANIRNNNRNRTYSENIKGKMMQGYYSNMIQSELNLHENFSVYEIIAEKFEHAFCISVY